MFNICYPAKTLVCLSWILFGRPFDRNWLTMQPLFCYIFKRSSACDWLFLLTTLHSLSPLWKRGKCSPRQSKNSKIFPGEHAPGPPYKFVYSLPKRPPPPPPPRRILATRLARMRLWPNKSALIYKRMLYDWVYFTKSCLTGIWPAFTISSCMLVIFMSQTFLAKSCPAFKFFHKLFLRLGIKIL